MMFKINKSKIGMYRVVVVIQNRSSGCLLLDPDDCDERGYFLCKGVWRRHDDNNLDFDLEKDFRAILNVYKGMSQYTECMVSIEHKPYRD